MTPPSSSPKREAASLLADTKMSELTAFKLNRENREKEAGYVIGKGMAFEMIKSSNDNIQVRAITNLLDRS